MRRCPWAVLLATALGAIATACGGGEAPAAGGGEEAPPTPMPYQRVPAGEEDPGDYGPGDDTVLEAFPGGMGDVRFSHFTHASNKESGYGVPCRECHHATPRGEDPCEGCVGCHETPEAGADPAHSGPEDNLVLVGDEQNLDMIGPVPFNHFTHASSGGYKIGCERCHHTGDPIACTECHGAVAMIGADCAIVPRGKRAFHLLCSGCHGALAESDPSTRAPVSCDRCHTEHGPNPLGGHLTLDRALHRMCIDCHAGVRAAKAAATAPARECASCHKDGAAQLPKKAAAEEEKAEEEKAEEEKADAGAAPSAGGDAPPAKVRISLGEAGKKTAELTHAAHNDYTEGCSKCHHKGLEDPSCSGCHGPDEARKIFHGLCIECHRENGVPSGCSDCHPK